MAWLYLALAVVAEVVATSALKAADGFTRPVPVVLVVVGYGLAFWLLSLLLRELPVGIVYAIWSGLGIVLVTLAAIFLYGQRPDMPALIGMGLIVAGVVVIQLFSEMHVS
ncbi:MAG: QacE family quaternary ammonium compound efflux SMR transporter [Gammaproteobacteria bacterium]|nr:MAG: QacE family quaternary ammonium compound efflux SMR transporter [Gammaproteobacteria bacterium]